MVSNIMLIDSIEKKGYLKDASYNIGLKTIEEGLRTAGYSGQVQVMPDEHMQYHNLEFHIEEAPADTLYGISACTNHLSNALRISRTIRKYKPNAKIVFGGPVVKKELTHGRYMEPIEILLRKGYADAAFQGDCSPFVKWIVDYGADPDAPDIPGYYRLKDGQVLGSGKGSLPELEHVPMTKRNTWKQDAKTSIIYSLLPDGCSNKCYFCTPDENRAGITPDSVLKSFRQSFEPGIFTQFDYFMSNPLQGRNLIFTEELMSKLDQEFRGVYKWVYVEPTSLGKDFKRLTEIIDKHRFSMLYFGRDAIDSRIAELLGSNYLNQPKTQRQLDKDLATIVNTVDFCIGKSQKSWKVPRTLTVNYIATPFETPETALAMIEEALMFQTMGYVGVRVNTNITLLGPLPGSRIKGMCLDMLADPEDIGNHGIDCLPWKQDVPGYSILQMISEHRKLVKKYSWHECLILMRNDLKAAASRKYSKAWFIKKRDKTIIDTMAGWNNLARRNI